MKRARIRLAMEGYRVDRELVYDPADERQVLMAAVREEIGKHLSRWKRAVLRCKSDKWIWSEIVSRANVYFARRPRDLKPTTWPDFRAWAIRRNYLTVTESTDEQVGPSCKPPGELAGGTD